MRELTAKEVIFVAAYLVDLNGQKAAKAAKYGTPRITAYRVLARPVVQAAIEAGQAAKMAKFEIDGDRVVRELVKLGLANMADYTIKIMNADRTYLSFDATNLTRDQMAAISEVGFDQHGRPKIKMHDKQAALVALGKHLGLFREDVYHHLPDAAEVQKAIEDMTPQEAASEWARACADAGV